jgi:hypothetical protein
VYLLAALVAFPMTRRMRDEIDVSRRLTVVESPPASGLQRLEMLLTEIDTARKLEEERPSRRLPYMPRGRAGSG